MRAFLVGTVDLDFAVDAARPQDGRVDQVGAVRREDDDDIVEENEPEEDE